MAEIKQESDGPKTIKLQNQWSFWYSPRGRNSKPNAKQNYKANITHLGDINTVEDFISYYCYLKKPSEVPVDNKMIFFRKGDLPCWEVTHLIARIRRKRLTLFFRVSTKF